MDSPVSSYWDETTVHPNLKFERYGSNGASPRPCKEEQNSYRYCDGSGNLNFTTAVNSEDDEYNYNKKKISRDPMSHRIIEKRRRDRMNNCLADLSRLIPADYLKKGRGRIEKTEIIEMAIKHMKYLQAHVCSHIDGYNVDSRPSSTPRRHVESDDNLSPPPDSLSKERATSIFTEHYRQGYHECLTETMHFLIEVEGFYAHDSLCVSLVNHLRKHCDKQGDRISLNGDSRPSTNSNDSPRSPSSSPTSGVRGTNSSLSKRSNGDQGSSSSCEGGCASRNMDDLYEGHHPSQLRDILTCPNVSSTNCMSRIQLDVDSSSPTMPLSHHHSSSISSIDSNHSASSLYKFKNNIKQRFTAEHTDRDNVIHSSSTMTSNSPVDVSIVPRSTKRQRLIDQAVDSDTGGSSPSPQQQQANCTPLRHTPSLQNIPVFVLHAKGSYYIPLTVDYEALVPYLGESGFDSYPTNLSSVVLHPVTISVNFHHQKSLNLYPSSPLSNGWSQQNGVTTTGGLVPLPKWTTSCTPQQS